MLRLVDVRGGLGVPFEPFDEVRPKLAIEAEKTEAINVISPLGPPIKERVSSAADQPRTATRTRADNLSLGSGAAMAAI